MFVWPELVDVAIFAGPRNAEPRLDHIRERKRRCIESQKRCDRKLCKREVLRSEMSYAAMLLENDRLVLVGKNTSECRQVSRGVS